MKYQEFSKMLGIPLDPKWESYFIALYDYNPVLSRVNVGFIMSPPNETVPGEEEKAIELWSEILRLIPPLYIVAGNEDGKRWVEQNLKRNVQYLQGWYQSDVFLVMASIPLALTKKGQK